MSIWNTDFTDKLNQLMESSVVKTDAIPRSQATAARVEIARDHMIAASVWVEIVRDHMIAARMEEIVVDGRLAVLSSKHSTARQWRLHGFSRLPVAAASGIQRSRRSFEA